MTEFNKMQQVKRRLFAMRNGAVADSLRKNGAEYRIIFGLLLPQIVEIAQEIGYDEELAEQLWANVTTRESLLLAPMLINPASVDVERAVSMVNSVKSAEVADVLCHRLLRRIPQAFELVQSLADEDSSMSRYCAMRILWQFVYSNPDEAKEIAKNEIAKADDVTLPLAKQIVDEVDFMREA